METMFWVVSYFIEEFDVMMFKEFGYVFVCGQRIHTTMQN